MKKTVALVLVGAVSLMIGIGLLVRHQTATPYTVASVKVQRVIDGDTFVLTNNEHVRIIGIDTPERGQCGYKEATANLQKLIVGRRIILVTDGKQTTDKYKRLLRYVDVGGKDVGLQQILDGEAHARYDSLDGYHRHSRQDAYHKADDNSKNRC
jgi:endonuclease YncB( thermonuclease family)